MNLKKKVLLYCCDYLRDWEDKIKEHYYDERDEYTWEETVQVEQDVSFIVQGFGTSLAQQHETLAQEMAIQRQEMAQQGWAFAQAMERQRWAMTDTKDLEALREWFPDTESHIPPVLRMAMQAKCSWDTYERLVGMENARN